VTGRGERGQGDMGEARVHAQGHAEVLADPRWAGGRVGSRQGRAVGMAWLGPVILLGLSGVVGWNLFPELWAEGSPWAWAILASLLPGLHALVHAVRETLRWRRFGSTTLELDPFPGSLGGHVGGTVQIPLGRGGLSPALIDVTEGRTQGREGRFRVIVSCIHTRVSRSSTRSGQTRWDTVVWSEELEPALSRSAQGLACAFAVAVPEDLPPTEPASPSYHHWAVRVVGELPGEDFDQTFEVPVLATPEPLHARYVEPSRRAKPGVDAGAGAVVGASGMGSGAAAGGLLGADAPGAAATARTPTGPLGDLPRRTVRATPTARGIRLHYRMGREPTAGIVMALVGVVLGGTGVLIGGRSAGDLASADVFGLLIGGVGGLMGLAAGLFGLGLLLLGLYLLANSLEVELGPQHVRARRRLLGIPVSTRSAAVADLAGIDMTINGQVGQGAQARVSYQIVARRRDGKRLAMGDGIRGTPVAAALAALIEGATGHRVEKKARTSPRARAADV